MTESTAKRTPASLRAVESDRLEVLKTYKIYLKGQFPRSESGRSFAVSNPNGQLIANMCLCSRKDIRDAVVSARDAFHNWSSRTAYLRGQILYRVAEMLEGRRAQFEDELKLLGLTAGAARREVEGSVDRLVYYAGWADKFMQVFSAVNPVAAPYFNFSIPEACGVVGVIAARESPLLAIVGAIAAVIVGGNTCVVIASPDRPLCAVTLGEVLATSDLPAGVVNILTGDHKELLSPLFSHMDVNAILGCGLSDDIIREAQTSAALNVKRCSFWSEQESVSRSGPYEIMDFQETKTTWHPIGT